VLDGPVLSPLLEDIYEEKKKILEDIYEKPNYNPKIAFVKHGIRT